MSSPLNRALDTLRHLFAPSSELETAQRLEREHAARMRRLRIVNMQTELMDRDGPPRPPSKGPP